MLQQTRGFVLHIIRYSESSGIVKIFTENTGIVSCVVKSLFSKNARIRPALFGHLALLDLLIDNKPGRNLQYIREATIARSFYNISDSMLRSSILLFMTEVLYKSVKEEEANHSLFDFIEQSLDALNNTDIPVANFHLLFLIRLSEQLGFGPVHSLSGYEEHLDLITGLPEVKDPGHEYSISGESLRLLKELNLRDYTDLTDFKSPRNVRLDLLGKLTDFYRIHVPEMSELKSLKVLHEIMG